VASAPDLEAESTDAALQPPTLVEGRVLDRSGEGVPGVPIVGSGSVYNTRAPGSGIGQALATSGPGGAFRAPFPARIAGVRLESARGSGFATVRAAHVTLENANREQLIVVAPEIELAGTVVEAGGAPLAGAEVSFDVPLAALAGFPAVLDGTVATRASTVSGAEGRFTLARVPGLEGAQLFVQHKGHRSLESAAPSQTKTDLWLELARPEEKEPWLLGIVLRADGSPAKGAKVQLDGLKTEAGADGRFGLAQEWAFEEAPLVAALPGLQPAVLPNAGALLQGEYPPPLVHLQLGGPQLTIRGKVVDAKGEPCSGWKVNLGDGTVVTPSRVPFDLVEDLARGKKVATKTDKQGGFVLEGLLAREYVVQAYAEKSLVMVRSAPVAAGTQDLVLRVAADAVLERLSGVVVARDGTPIAGVQVAAQLVTASAGGAMSWQSGPTATTDSAGRFALARVPREGIQLGVDGAAILPNSFPLDLAAGEPRLSVARRCHLRVELATGTAPADGAPDQIEALDADGQHLSLNVIEGNAWSSSTRVALSRLGTNPLAVSEDARTLVFYAGDREVRRVPLALVPGEVAIVRPGG
jgi:hypothetical protein